MTLEDVKLKNIEAIRSLLQVAVREGNYLGDDWRDVLHCVSQLDQAELLNNRNTQAPAKSKSHDALSVITFESIFFVFFYKD